MKFHRSNMKTKRLVRKSLRSVKTLKKYKFFLAKIGPKKEKFKIPLPKPHAGSAKEFSYEVSSLYNMKSEGLVHKSLRSVKAIKNYKFFGRNRA